MQIAPFADFSHVQPLPRSLSTMVQQGGHQQHLQDAAECVATHMNAECVAPVLSWPGYGTLFFYQLGILQYLERTFDLTECTHVGSSAGSMLSVLAACNSEPQAALDLAHQLCIQHHVFERPLGLVGIWGGIVREWLDTQLPADASDRCSGRVRIVITTLPWLQREVVTTFKDRADLIDCCLASSHIPFLLDGRATAECRGRRCVDGSMLYILTGRCHGLRPVCHLSRLLLFDPFSDRQLLQGWDLLRCVLLCGKEGAQQLLDRGYQHAADLDASGALAALEPYRRVQAAAEGLMDPGIKGQAAGAASLCIASSLSSSSSGFSASESVCSAGGSDRSDVAVLEPPCDNTSVFRTAGDACADAVAVISEGNQGSK